MSPLLLEDLIIELQKYGWFVSELYHNIDNRFNLALYNSTTEEDEFENTHDSIKLCFQEAYDLLIGPLSDKKLSPDGD